MFLLATKVVSFKFFNIVSLIANYLCLQWVRHLEDGSVNFIEGTISLFFPFVLIRYK